MALVTGASLVQTFLSLVILLALGNLLAVLGVAAVLEWARLSRHCLHEEVCAYLGRLGKRTGFANRLGLVLLVGGPRSLFLFRLTCMLRPTRLAPLLFFLRQVNKWVNMCEISPYAEIGPGLQIFHGHGILICEGVRIGRNAWLFQNVNIGSNYGNMPTLGDDVIVFAGGRVFGDIRVGNNVILTNNVLVIADVPDDSVVKAHDPVVISKRGPESNKIRKDPHLP